MTLSYNLLAFLSYSFNAIIAREAIEAQKKKADYERRHAAGNKKSMKPSCCVM